LRRCVANEIGQFPFITASAASLKKNGTVSYLGQQFEVPYELSGKTVELVVDPHGERVIGVENDAGESLGSATALDLVANLHVRPKLGCGGCQSIVQAPAPSPARHQ